jgi:hypothetical protein
MSGQGYNERIFTGGLRARLHLSRFTMLAGSLNRLDFQPESVVELGCFDGKTIDYLPVKPARYVGLDANWEGGLDLARQSWGGESAFKFLECKTPEDIRLEEKYDLSVCMEMLEHVPSEMVAPYLEKLAGLTTKFSFITVPNEIGLVLAAKYISKRLSGMAVEAYTLSELWNAMLGKTEFVLRNEHKGFDYRILLESVSQYFDVIDVFPTPYRWLPRQAGFGICIVAAAKDLMSLSEAV